MLPQPSGFREAEDAHKEKEILLEKLREEVVKAESLTLYSKQEEREEVDNRREAERSRSAGEYFRADQHDQMADLARLFKDSARNESLDKLEFVQRALEEMSFHQQEAAAEPQEETLLREELNRLRALALGQAGGHESPTRGNPAFLQDNQTPVVPATAQPTDEDEELAMAISASLRPVMQDNQTPIIPATAQPNEEDLELAKAINASLQPVMQDNQTPTFPATAQPPEEDLELTRAINASLQHVMQDNQTPVVPPTAQPAEEDLELAMAINASLQPAMQERPTLAVAVDAHLTSEASSTSNHTWSSSSQPLASGPSAPPVSDAIIEDGTPIHYPSVDSSPIDLLSPTTIGIGSIQARAGDKKEDDGCLSSCIICLDAPVEGACVPCGHMVGCMSCLNEIKDAKGTCPVCRAKIHQVLKVYTF
ncbi:probable E3 ubiquitin-protein ligase XBOS34 [Ziziphus jujuba]|uniref:Probable E3 ubiquitin-protein ligase XBOS34 n=1 Tax=Ziziphus jujuba TaxID=326968 RepID=A0A6P6GAK4_ZIZJJ|nr:probable E3 ubiquitin-protein ligase XBOS34 [Ziziphus jujuba]